VLRGSIGIKAPQQLDDQTAPRVQKSSPKTDSPRHAEFAMAYPMPACVLQDETRVSPF
jgi:hypothetical protein